MSPEARPVVLKFGGAGLRDGAAIQHAARLVAAHPAGVQPRATVKGPPSVPPAPRAVVASALEGVTDLLGTAQQKVRGDDAQVLPFLEALRRRHTKALEEAAPGDDAARYAIESGLQRLERLLYGIAYTEERTPRLHDLVQSFGERLAVPLLAGAIRHAGSDAVALDAEHAGLRTLGPFGDAHVDLDAVAREAGPILHGVLERGAVPVVTGYYGVDAAGNATLFGRGGSDFVASLVAHAIHAERIELWKDVPGFMTADPRIVPGAHLVAELGYDEAAELANVGAKVLHPRCVEPARAAGIPIHVRSLVDPGAPGTVIRDGAAPPARLVRSVTTRSNVTVVRVGGAALSAGDTLELVARSLKEAGVRVHAASLAGTGIAIAVGDAPEGRIRGALETIPSGRLQTVETLSGRSLVVAVGRGLATAAGHPAKVLQAVAQAGVQVEMACIGGSPLAISFVVAGEDAPGALRALHAGFLEGK